MKMKMTLLAAALAAASMQAWAQKYKADVPKAIVTPDNVQTRIGTLKFVDGLPDEETVRKVYDNLDFVRGVEAFQAGIPATSVEALKRGFIEAGYPCNEGIGITESRADARSLFLTANATVIYQWACHRRPARADGDRGGARRAGSGQRRVLPLSRRHGQFGPDQGKGGKYLVVHEGYKGALPKGLLRHEDADPQQPDHHPLVPAEGGRRRQRQEPRRRRHGSIRCPLRPTRPRRSS